MSRTKTVLITVSAVVVVAAMAAAIGCGGPRHRFMTPERVKKMATWHVNDLLDDLDADDAQRQQVLALKDRLVDDALAFHAASRDTHRVMVQAWGQEQPDAKKLHALVDERLDALRVLAHEAVDASVELHGILTPEQRQAVLEKIAKHQER